jgi:hypothetical protein
MERIVVEGSLGKIEQIISLVESATDLSISETHKPMSDDEIQEKYDEGYSDAMEECAEFDNNSEDEY